MLNFTVGPVMSSEEVRAIGAEQVPYFRTPEFSQIMFENEALMKKFAKADENARVVFLTGSGTAAMEAAVINVFDTNDKVLIVNGGSFGQRFVKICQIHNIPYTEIKLSMHEQLSKFFRRIYYTFCAMLKQKFSASKSPVYKNSIHTCFFCCIYIYIGIANINCLCRCLFQCL